MGSPSVDLYGATRSAVDLKYGASILALDAATGKEKWVYQTVHNDLWDFDLPMAPTLIDFPGQDGKTTPALVVGTKAGQIFVLADYCASPEAVAYDGSVTAIRIVNRAGQISGD